MSDQPAQGNLFSLSGDGEWEPIFGDDFLPRLVGSIMQDPYFAVIELVANCWDAGASEVKIQWPEKQGDIFCIEDNGISMSKDEFRRRWYDLTYNRIEEQGSFVTFPKNTKRKRKAFGRNGVGRHAMFYFSSEYFIEIKKDDHLFLAAVRRSSGKRPLKIDPKAESNTGAHGTRIWCEVKNNPPFTAKEVAETIGVRFVADPEFRINVNNEVVEFEDLTEFSEELKAILENGEEIDIKRFDSEKVGRTSKQSGIAYWVNKRVISHSNKEGLMRKPSKPQDHPGKRAGGEHPDEAMSSKRRSTAFFP